MKWSIFLSLRFSVLVITFWGLVCTSALADNRISAPEQILSDALTAVNNITTDELIRLIEKESELRIIDVRMPDEIATLGGTIHAGLHPLNINRGWLEFRIADAVPDKNTPIVVFCGINQRSPLAAQTLMQLGYRSVFNYTDGFFAWQKAGLPVALADEAPGTMLFSAPIEVIPGVWTSIGATAPATFENSGHNNNLSFIITDEGVVVMNAGDNYLLAQALHREIKSRTDQPVRYVILENGQGHAMLGMNYWQEQGAIVIAHEDAIDEITHNGEDILQRMQRRNRDKSMATVLSTPDESMAEKKVIELGGWTMEILNLGPAHSPGDILLWLPQKKLVISGDMAFHQRLLPVFEHTDTAAWIDTWDSFAALDATIVIPGHGGPTNMPEVELYTLGYLTHMRTQIGDLIESGGTLIDAYKVDQSAYRHLDTFRELAVRNADQIYRAMEFE